MYLSIFNVYKQPGPKQGSTPQVFPNIYIYIHVWIVSLNVRKKTYIINLYVRNIVNS